MRKLKPRDAFELVRRCAGPSSVLELSAASRKLGRGTVTGLGTFSFRKPGRD